MPVFIAALLGGIYQALGSLVGRVLISLGIGYVTFSGVDVALSWFRDQAFASLASASSISPVITQMMGVLQIGTCLNILFSAFSTRLILQGVTSGTLKRMVNK